MRFTDVGGFVADPGVTLIPGAATIGRRSAAAHTDRTSLARCAELAVVTRRTVEYGLSLALVGTFVTNAGVALIAGAAAIGSRPAVAKTQSARFADGAELTVVARESFVCGLGFTGIRGFVANTGVTLIAGAAAIRRRAAAADTRRTRLARGAELTVIARRPVEDGLRFAGVGGFVAHPVVALIAGAAAIGRRSAAARPGGTGFAYRTELTVVASRTVEDGLRFAGIGGFVAHPVVALVAGAAAIRRRTAAAHACRTGFARCAKLTVVAGRPVEDGLCFAGIGGLVAHAAVALIAGAAAIGGRPAAASPRRTGFARCAELTVVAGESLVGGLCFTGIRCFIAHAGVALIAGAAAIGGQAAAANAGRTSFTRYAELEVVAT